MAGKSDSVRPVIVASSLISLSVYIVLGYCGYLTFRSSTLANIIDNLPKDTLAVTICRFAVSILVAFSYPLQIHPCRTSLLNLLSVLTPKAKTPLALYSVTLLLCVVTYTVSFFVQDLGIVFSIVGATGSVTLCYILPGSFYVKLFWNDPWDAKKIFALVLAGGGVLLMVNSLIWIGVRANTAS